MPTPARQDKRRTPMAPGVHLMVPQLPSSPFKRPRMMIGTRASTFYPSGATGTHILVRKMGVRQRGTMHQAGSCIGQQGLGKAQLALTM